MRWALLLLDIYKSIKKTLCKLCGVESPISYMHSEITFGHWELKYFLETSVQFKVKSLYV